MESKRNAMVVKKMLIKRCRDELTGGGMLGNLWGPRGPGNGGLGGGECEGAVRTARRGGRSHGRSGGEARFDSPGLIGVEGGGGSRSPCRPGLADLAA